MYLTLRNISLQIKENFYESEKLFLIQRNFFFNRILKKYCFNSKNYFRSVESGLA